MSGCGKAEVELAAPNSPARPTASPLSTQESRIFIVARTGNDSQHTEDSLTEAGFQTFVCGDMRELIQCIAQGCGAILLAEEAMDTASVKLLVEALSKQPSWSDIPITLITSEHEAGQTWLRQLNTLGPGGNVLLLERPFRPATLISAMSMALRSRERQYEVRNLLEDRQQAAAELEQMVIERTQALRETVNELEAFSYSITHDMRGPLRSITSYVQFVISDYGHKLDDVGNGFLRRACDSAERLDRLIVDVLNYSRLSRVDLELERINTEKLIRDVITEYPNLQVHHEHITIEGPLPDVMANQSGLTQCLSNLLNNAVKFVRPGEPPRVRVYSQIKDSSVRLSFEDKGIGIPREYQAQIFGAFNRLHDPDAYEGTGIGLAIVRRAIERMNGRLGLDSETAKGSTFWIELPLAQTHPNV